VLIAEPAVLQGECAVKAISFSGLMILVLMAIAALAQEPVRSLGQAAAPPNGYVGLSALPTPHEFWKEAQEPQSGTGYLLKVSGSTPAVRH
jgi:hypothetical protein